jgi:hypothetical protein
MSGSIIENEGDRLHLSAQRFRNDLLLHKSLEIGKAFALSARSVDFAKSPREACKQVASATTMITRGRRERVCLPAWGEVAALPRVLEWRFSHRDRRARYQFAAESWLGHRPPTRDGLSVKRWQDHGYVARHGSAKGEGVRFSTSVPPCWPRYEGGPDVEPHAEPILPDSNARAVPVPVWASYRQWR